MTRVSFRIRRVYYDAIVAGTKTIEVREDKPYWRDVAWRVQKAMFRNETNIAVFVCGREVHRRFITGTVEAAAGSTLLGRELSVQGKKDVGLGRVIGFQLGRVAA